MKLHSMLLPKMPLHLWLSVQKSKRFDHKATMPSSHGVLRCASQAGFTLLELLVVVALIATLSGLAVVAYDSNGDDSVATQLAQSEMTELAKALRQFRRDVGRYPTVAHPADFSPLFVNNTGTTFNRDTGRGWHGPYLERRGIGCAEISGALNITNRIEPYAKMDPFRGASPINGINRFQYDASNACPTSPEDRRNLKIEPPYGAPYLLLLSQDDCIRDLVNAGKTQAEAEALIDNPLYCRPRIVSLGADGKYGGANIDPDRTDPDRTDVCQPKRTNDPRDPGNDDLVLCL